MTTDEEREHGVEINDGPRIIAVEEAGPTRPTSTGLQPSTDDDDDDPAEPNEPSDPDTDNEPDNEPEGDGDNAPGDDKPAEIQL